jgi:adenylate kinase family enzyme
VPAGWELTARRIHIVGGPGSGKTVTAARLAEAYGIPSTDLDRLFWRRASGRYGVKAPPEERDAALTRILAQPAWITEGVYLGWVRRCFEEADVVLVMSAPVWVRHRRILVRFLKRRIGLEKSKRESVADLVDLLRWNHSYDGDNLAAVRRTLRDLGRTAVDCRNAAEALRAVERHPASG